MIRLIPVSIILALASVASGQIIFEPPPRLEIYNPYGGNLNPRAIRRLYSLSSPRVIVNVCVAPNGLMAAPLIAPIPGELYPVYEPIGFDPLTGQALHFRMRDLLPPLPVQPEPKDLRDDQQPATRDAPASFTAPSPVKKGEIRITPWRPGGAETPAGR